MPRCRDTLWLRIMCTLISDSKIFTALLHADLSKTSFAIFNHKCPVFCTKILNII